MSMFWILYRHPADHSTTLLETDNFPQAVFVLQRVVRHRDDQLIDFSGDLDGALDDTLAGVRLFDAMTETAA
jgi:hypothetical protein